MVRLLLVAGLVFGGSSCVRGANPAAESREAVIHPQILRGPLRNPLMGFIGPADGRQPYATLDFEYVRWNAIENSAADGVDKLRDYADTHWKGVEQRNIKVIPRVFLELPKGSGLRDYWPITSYWPGDMPRDYNSAQFKERVSRMVAKMGEAWDSDSRVAFLEMGIIGAWGEQHHPSPSTEMQQLLGDAFQKAFKRKLVMNRYPWQFTDYPFGIYWDSFGNPGWEIRTHVAELEGRLSERWKIAPMGGEMSFSNPNSGVPRLALTPTEAVVEHADTLVRYIRRWHWTDLGWVSNYDLKNAAANAGAARIQETFGYRYVLEEVRYSRRSEQGGDLDVSFSVRNVGSAPMYYNWPVEISLLDSTSREPVWKATFPDLDIRRWLPGDFSDKGKGRRIGDNKHTLFEWDTGLEYDIPAVGNKVSGSFKLPASIPAGKYVLALAILDPAGNLPSIKFAIKNYFKGGRHPIGFFSLAVDNPQPDLDPTAFDDPTTDVSLHYVAERRAPDGSK